jgi:hypothetical protein
MIYKYSNLLLGYSFRYYMAALAQSVGTDSSVSLAIGAAFDILGPVSKQKLFERLRIRHGIEIRSVTTEDMQKVKRAILDLFGEDAANMLMNIVYSEVDKI